MTILNPCRHQKIPQLCDTIFNPHRHQKSTQLYDNINENPSKLYLLYLLRIYEKKCISTILCSLWNWKKTTTKNVSVVYFVHYGTLEIAANCISLVHLGTQKILVSCVPMFIWKQKILACCICFVQLGTQNMSASCIFVVHLGTLKIGSFSSFVCLEPRTW